MLILNLLNYDLSMSAANQLTSGLDIYLIDKNKKNKNNSQQLQTHCWFQCHHSQKEKFPLILPFFMNQIRQRQIN